MPRRSKASGRPAGPASAGGGVSGRSLAITTMPGAVLVRIPGGAQYVARTPAALERIYALLRAGQDADALGTLDPAEGMRRLARGTFRLFRAHPEIVALMNEENLHRARHVRAMPRIRARDDGATDARHRIDHVRPRQHAVGR